MRKNTPLIVAIVHLLLPVLYVGSYLALVNPDYGAQVWDWSGGTYENNYPRCGTYSAYTEMLFWPLEQADRRLLPDRWKRMEFYQPEIG